MQIDIDLFTDELLSSKLSAMKSTYLIPDWTSYHCELKLYFSSASFGNLIDVAIENVSDLSYKIVFSINESQDLTVATKDTFMCLLSLCLCL